LRLEYHGIPENVKYRRFIASITESMGNKLDSSTIYLLKCGYEASLGLKLPLAEAFF